MICENLCAKCSCLPGSSGNWVLCRNLILSCLVNFILSSNQCCRKILCLFVYGHTMHILTLCVQYIRKTFLSYKLLHVKPYFPPSDRTDRLPAITHSPVKSAAHTVSVKTSVEWIYWLGLRSKSFIVCFFFFLFHTAYYSPDLMNLICWHVSLSVLLDPVSHFFLLYCFLGNRSSRHIGVSTSCKSTRLRWLQLAWRD